VRSQLHVPAGAAEELSAARGYGADALVVDLAAVPAPAERASAGQETVRWLRAGQAGPVWVRISAGPAGMADARAVVSRELTGVCVVGAESATELAALAVVLAEAEEKLGLPIGTVKMAPQLESAAAVLAAPQLARAPRVTWLGLGEERLSAELGVEPGPDERELLWVRSQVVAASAAARIAAPVGPLCADVEDLARLRQRTIALRRLGFWGRACLHPDQLPVVHDVFGGAQIPISPVVA
jgi:citrate lyase subunit beta/citryl-CoA lyase